LKPTVVAVVGTKKSGKTTTIENLMRELTRRGYKVAGIKHVPEPEHTIDTPGKDTWRYAQAGAKTIISAAPNEIATIERTKLEKVPIERLVKKCEGDDIVFVEGLKKRLSLKRNVPKIVVAKTMNEAVNASKTYKPIIAFSGPYSTENLNFTIPYANALSDLEKLADIIESNLLKKRIR
jgi:molybdopterin-guanine dinucleotide biosynthesis protein B